MTQTIQFEGQTHEFPDDFTEADIQAALSTVKPAAPPPVTKPNPNRRQTIGVADRGDFGENAKDVAHNAATGVAKGLSDVAGMPVDLLNLPGTIGRLIGDWTGIGGTKRREEAKANSTIPTLGELPGGSEDFQDLVFNHVMPEYVPATLEGKVGQGLMRGATGNVALPSKMAGAATKLGSAALGGASGAASEAAGAISDDNPVIKFAAGMLPYVGKGLADVGRGRAAINASRDALNGVDDAALALAKEREATAAQHGFRLTPGQALGSSGAGVRSLEGSTAASAPGAGPAGTFVRENREGADRAIQAEVGKLGAPDNVANLGEDVSRGASNRISQFRRWRRQKSGPLYQAAEEAIIPNAELRPIVQDLNDQISRKGIGSDIGQRLAEYRDQLLQFTGEEGAKVGPLNEMRKTYRDGIRSSLPPQDISNADRQAAAIIGPMNEKLNDVLMRNNQAFGDAQRVHASRSGPVDYIERPDVLGRLAVDAEKDPVTKLAQQLSVIADPKRTSPKIIDNVFSEMDASSRPKAMAQLGAKYFDMATEQAKGRATRFHDLVYGSPKRQAITESILGNIAKANGKDPADVQRGWRRLLDVVDQSRHMPAVGSPTAPRAELNKAFSEAGIYDSIREGVPVVSALNKKWSQHGLRTNYKMLADTFFGDQGGIDALVALSKKSASGEAAKQLVGSYLAGRRSTNPQEDQE